MSTNNMSDEELDQLFRESAEGYEPPFNPTAWADMDQRLDAFQAGRGRGAWFYPLLLLLLFLSVLSIPALLPPTSEKPISAGSLQLERAYTLAGKPTNSSETKRQTGGLPTLESLPVAVHSNVKTGGLTQADKVRVERFSPEFQKRSQKQFVHKNPVHGLSFLPGRKKSTKLQNPSPGEEGLVSENASRLARSVPLLQQEEENIISTKAETPVTAAQVEKRFVTLDSAEHDNKAPTPAQDTLEEKQTPEEGKEKHFLKNIQVGVAIAPDVTTVKFKGADRVSPSAGVLVAVPLSRRLSVMTGAVWARKMYSAAPEEYTTPSGTPMTSYQNDIDAVCQVIDIPVNLRYKVWESGSNSLALQAGLSSYIMVSEKYTYHYMSSYGSGNPPKSYTKTWEVDNKNRHWFQVQNISVGYVRTFASGFSLGMEPFVKIPLSGIGEGQVNLTSAGVFFSTSYTFHLKP